MLLVKARLAFILRDVWYTRLPNNRAVFTISIKYRQFLQQLTDSNLQQITETEQDR
jgi:hypothetical protein